MLERNWFYVVSIIFLIKVIARLRWVYFFFFCVYFPVTLMPISTIYLSLSLSPSLPLSVSLRPHSLSLTHSLSPSPSPAPLALSPSLSLRELALFNSLNTKNALPFFFEENSIPGASCNIIASSANVGQYVK